MPNSLSSNHRVASPLALPSSTIATSLPASLPPAPADVFEESDPIQVQRTPRQASLARLEELKASVVQPSGRVSKIIASSFSQWLDSFSAIAISAGINYIISGDQADPMTRGLTRMTLLNTVSNSATSLVQKIVKSFQEAPTRQGENFEAVLRALQEDDALNLRARTGAAADTQTAVQALDREVAELIRQGGKEEKIHILLAARQAFFLGYPRSIVNISHQVPEGKESARLAIDAKVARLVDEYPTSSRSDLLRLIDHMRANCYLRAPNRAQALLLGPPGTGKTRFVYRLSEALGLPLISYKFNHHHSIGLLPKGDYEATRQFDQRSLAGEEKVNYGMLACSAWDAGVLNPILFLDEMGEALQTRKIIDELKIGLDSELGSMVMGPYGGMRIDLSRVTLLMASNTPIKDAALASRVPTLRFDGIDRDKKRLVLRQIFHEQADNHAELGATFCANLMSRADSCLDDILAEDVRRGIAGVRIAKQVLFDVFGHLRGALMRGEEIASSDMRLLIEQAFSQRLLLNPREFCQKMSL